MKNSRMRFDLAIKRKQKVKTISCFCFSVLSLSGGTEIWERTLNHRPSVALCVTPVPGRLCGQFSGPHLTQAALIQDPITLCCPSVYFALSHTFERTYKILLLGYARLFLYSLHLNHSSLAAVYNKTMNMVLCMVSLFFLKRCLVKESFWPKCMNVFLSCCVIPKYWIIFISVSNVRIYSLCFRDKPVFLLLLYFNWWI